jgi:hypothetical protein
VFLTYATTGRGVEALGSVWTFLDLTPLGRQEEWEDTPPGRPQTPRTGGGDCTTSTGRARSRAVADLEPAAGCLMSDGRGRRCPPSVGQRTRLDRCPAHSWHRKRSGTVQSCRCWGRVAGHSTRSARLCSLSSRVEAVRHHRSLLPCMECSGRRSGRVDRTSKRKRKRGGGPEHASGPDVE